MHLVRFSFWLGHLPWLLLAAGCQADTVDIGDEGAAGSAGTGPASATETWTGYIENYQFLSGSDDLTLVFESRDATSVTGTVVFGQGSPPLVDPELGYPPPPPVDPELGYPPGLDWSTHQLVEGFAFAILQGTVEGSRLTFTINPGEQWQEWCEAQTSYGDEGNYMCLPHWGDGSDGSVCYVYNETGERWDVDCAKLQMCLYSEVCKCNADGCIAGDPISAVSFDLSLDEETAEGSVDFGDLGDVHNVHLTRSE